MPRYGIPVDVARALPEFLARWGIVRIEVTEIEEGYENQNLLVDSTTGRFVIRRYSFRDPQDIPFELEVLRACADRGFPVAKPVPDLKGEYVHRLGDLPAVVFEFVDGEHPQEGTAGDRRRIGGWLAEFHDATGGLRPAARKRYDDFTELRRADELRPEFERRGYIRFLNDLDQFNRVDLPQLERSWPTLRHGIVHGDVYPGNLLVRDGRLVALLDFDTAFYGALVRDIADAILCWSDQHPDFEPDVHAFAEIVAGYELVRPLLEQERAILRTTLLLACLSDAIRTISLRMRLSRPFERDEECHMYCRYLKLRDDATRTSA